MSEDNFALPEENVKPTEPYIQEEFPQVDPNAVEQELVEKFQEMQENMPHQDVAAHFFQMYGPIYKNLVNALSSKDLKRLAWHAVQWPLEDENPKFHDEKAKQAFALAIRLSDCKMIMRTHFEMERMQEIQAQKLKSEQEAAEKAAQQPLTEGEANNGEQV